MFLYIVHVLLLFGVFCHNQSGKTVCLLPVFLLLLFIVLCSVVYCALFWPNCMSFVCVFLLIVYCDVFIWQTVPVFSYWSCIVKRLSLTSFFFSLCCYIVAAYHSAHAAITFVVYWLFHLFILAITLIFFIGFFIIYPFLALIIVYWLSYLYLFFSLGTQVAVNCRQ